MKYLALALFVTLSACKTMEPRKEYVYVDRPIAINCIKEKPVRPQYQTERLLPTATDLEFADALAYDWAKSRPYEKAMEDAVTACLVR